MYVMNNQDIVIGFVADCFTAQVESQLKSTNDGADGNISSNNVFLGGQGDSQIDMSRMGDFAAGFGDASQNYSNASNGSGFGGAMAATGGAPLNQFTNQFMNGLTMDDPLTWDLISLGLEEPLPPDDVVEELCVMEPTLETQR